MHIDETTCSNAPLHWWTDKSVAFGEQLLSKRFPRGFANRKWALAGSVNYCATGSEPANGAHTRIASPPSDKTKNGLANRWRKKRRWTETHQQQERVFLAGCPIHRARAPIPVPRTRSVYYFPSCSIKSSRRRGAESDRCVCLRAPLRHWNSFVSTPSRLAANTLFLRRYERNNIQAIRITGKCAHISLSPSVRLLLSRAALSPGLIFFYFPLHLISSTDRG